MQDSPFESFTRATFRLAELGFLGLAIKICVQTPFFWGELSRRGDFESSLRWCGFFRRIAWFMVAEAGREAWKERSWWDTERGEKVTCLESRPAGPCGRTSWRRMDAIRESERETARCFPGRVASVTPSRKRVM